MPPPEPDDPLQCRSIKTVRQLNTIAVWYRQNDDSFCVRIEYLTHPQAGPAAGACALEQLFQQVGTGNSDYGNNRRTLATGYADGYTRSGSIHSLARR